MHIGIAVAIAAIWGSVVGALFATASNPYQPLVGLIGFVCALLATHTLAKALSKKESGETVSVEKKS